MGARVKRAKLRSWLTRGPVRVFSRCAGRKQLRASAGDETGRRAFGAFSRHPALAEFHNHDPWAAAVVRSATSQPSVRLLIRLSRITCTSHPVSGNGIICQLPAVDVPPDGVKKWANSPVQKVALVKAPNSAVPKRVDVEPYHLT